MKSQTYSWQLQAPLDAVVFDCDGTLSMLEGIDVLAEQNGVGAKVHELTELAMGSDGISADLFQQRMSLVKPSRTQLIALAEAYFTSRVTDIVRVLDALRSVGKAIYVVSAGLNPAVTLFAEMLDIDADHVFAVDVTFTAEGDYQNFEANSPTARHGGKREVIQFIQHKYPRVMHIGDGMNDVEVSDMVERFIGYGGACFRTRIAEQCEFYIRSASLAPVLPLALTAAEVNQLNPQGRRAYQDGLDGIHARDVFMPN